ncbi:hypothetical protein KP509_01G127600 [Ceratopteris richardii]|uniref:Adenine DNA glycosylase n=1 Tax=Ceratopteris richardii TaxID=49495 RepID=A0A8T2VR20_CERRI|nr:hypothetical protein KP509_01G127600 [Ceratopteris richardii]
MAELASTARPAEPQVLPTPKCIPRLGVRKLPSKRQAIIADIEDSAPCFSKEQAAVIRGDLLTWYTAHHRKLPWRFTQDSSISQDLRQRRAYATWVSEVMLQQTRVATVIDYFNRWMNKWPTVRDLASATQEEVNSVWAGLGYYRRARFLLEGAKQIVEVHEGLLPSSSKQLQKIRGIGRYTAGAIASIAFDQPVPVVDGNVVRVLCRLKAISNVPRTSSTMEILWTLAEQLVDDKRPGDLNQALMELGATICSPTSPQCLHCPLKETCVGYKLSQETQNTRNPVQVTDYPMKAVKPAPRQEYVAVCVLEKSVISGYDTDSFELDATDSCLLLVRRPKTGLLAGLWEFPSASLESDNPSLKACRAAIDKYLESILGIRANSESELVIERKLVGAYKHVFSHIHMHMKIEWMRIHVDKKGIPYYNYFTLPSAFALVKRVIKKTVGGFERESVTLLFITV